MKNFENNENESGKALTRLQLHGFNNLTKTLCMNIYDICYAKEEHQQAYLEYIDEAYNAERLTRILTDVSNIIGAQVLNIARQDYDPEGASVAMLIAESIDIPSGVSNSGAPGPLPDNVVAHLDKSHITVHTYPESHPDNGIRTFRTDIDVSTCGLISPLKALNFLIHSFDSDIVILDYRVRGFTRDIGGRKHYIDHDITSIQNFLSEDTRRRYQTIDVNIYQENIYHTKMLLKEFDFDNYLFDSGGNFFSRAEKTAIQKQLRQEMSEIFQACNYDIQANSDS